MDIRFGDHPSFHRAAAGMVGGALLASLAVFPFAPGVAPLVGGVAGIAAGAALGYGKTRARLVFGALAIAPLFAMTMGWASELPAAIGFLLSASLLALGLAVGGPRGVRGALGVGWSALVALLGMWCALRVFDARETEHWPVWITAVASAAALGMVAILAMLPRHLTLDIDPVKTAARGLPGALEAEVRTLCDRSLAIWRTMKDSPGVDEAGRHLVRDGVLKTLEVAHKTVDVKATGASDDELAARMAELDSRIAATTDDEAKTQYQAARAALDDQARYRGHIAKGRERLVARMHNHVAALEKFHLAATGLASARAASEGASVVKQLEELSQDVAASGEALAEIELGAPSDDAVATSA